MSWSVLSPPPVHILAQLLKITTTLSEVMSLVVALHIVPVVPILLCDGIIDVHIATHANDCHIHRSDVHVMHVYLVFLKTLLFSKLCSRVCKLST